MDEVAAILKDEVAKWRESDGKGRERRMEARKKNRSRGKGEGPCVLRKEIKKKKKKRINSYGADIILIESCANQIGG